MSKEPGRAYEFWKDNRYTAIKLLEYRGAAHTHTHTHTHTKQKNKKINK